MDFYLSKPLDPNKLSVTLDQFLKNKRDGHNPDVTPAPTTQSTTTLVELSTPINLEELHARFCNNSKLVQMVLDQFEKQLNNDITVLEQILKDGDSQKLFKQAHALKGAAAAAGALRIRELAYHLEQLGKTSNIDKAEQPLIALKEASSQCLHFLNQLRLNQRGQHPAP